MLLSLTHRMQLIQAAWRRAWVRATGNHVGAAVMIGAHCNVARGHARARQGTVLIGDRTRLEQGVLLHPHTGSIRIGCDVFLGPGTVIYGHGGVEIGDECLIAMHCRILSSNHTVPAPDVCIRSQLDILTPTRIGRDVWLGAGVTVLAGVTIGDGCIVGAGAVVVHDLPPGSVAVGNPARIIRNR